MPVIKYDDIALSEINAEGVSQVCYSRVITDKHGWDGHCLRVFRLQPGGYTPHHSHNWEHVIHVIEGNGEVTINGEKFSLTAKDFAYVPPNEMHQFKNNSGNIFEFICIVPKAGDN